MLDDRRPQRGPEPLGALAGLQSVEVQVAQLQPLRAQGVLRQQRREVLDVLVTPVAGGQIVGLVNQLGDDGVTLTPLAGVEALADPEPIYYYEGADASLAQATARDGEAVTLKAITDSNGSYVIPAVPEGDYVVTVNVPGLVQGVAYVWVSPGSTAVADFQLVSVIEEGEI